MKTKKNIIHFLMFLPFIVTVIALRYIPDQIPGHYDLHLQVNRWANKYETLLLPVISIFCGWFMLALAKYATKQEVPGSNYEKECTDTCIILLLIFNVLTYIILCTDF